MSMIDDIKRDREAGTPGPWINSKFGCQVLTGDSWSSICMLKGAAGWEDGRGAYEQDYMWQIQEANARRIARLPDLEAKYIALKEAADELADALESSDPWPEIESALARYREASQ